MSLLQGWLASLASRREMVEARLFSQCRNGVEAASSIPSGCEAGRPWGRERRFLSLHRAAGRVGRGSLWFVCQTKVVDSLFLSLLRLPLFSHHQDELWLTKTYLPGFIYIYTRIYGASRRRQWHPTPVPLAWKIPWTEEPVRLQSTGSLRVGHN